jgi:hypothetical protein
VKEKRKKGIIECRRKCMPIVAAITTGGPLKNRTQAISRVARYFSQCAARSSGVIMAGSAAVLHGDRELNILPNVSAKNTTLVMVRPKATSKRAGQTNFQSGDAFGFTWPNAAPAVK